MNPINYFFLGIYFGIYMNMFEGTGTAFHVCIKVILGICNIEKR
jgi:hypothetical protein